MRSYWTLELVILKPKDTRYTKLALVLHLHVLTQKLHWKSAGINKDSNSTVAHCEFASGYVMGKIQVTLDFNTS